MTTTEPVTYIPLDVAALIRAGEIPEGSSYSARLRTARRQILLDALAEHGGNRTHAARALGIRRTYLLRLLRQHGIQDYGRAGVLPAVAKLSAGHGGA